MAYDIRRVVREYSTLDLSTGKIGPQEEHVSFEVRCPEHPRTKDQPFFRTSDESKIPGGIARHEARLHQQA